ncbi:ImmA/IrrE family metallo-endopeptidase [Pseudomonas lopnurensis]|uniref:ImmA/IrrE family metallo-endopeptidase n=1 Tax=Pseudomonas lopnurensis TaxID=1477517 RepID=UPI0028AC6466|nr:ImmA/IrrE family metallo-endopeptidase [Pseudomonas lopnurensis]
MNYREMALHVAQRAAEVIDETGAMDRIEQQGYTRVDPFQIAATSGVLVMLRPMEKLLGAFIGEASPGILINVDRPAGLVHMTCAHELGHFFMEHGSTADQQIYYDSKAAQIEQEADLFGYNLLAPRQVMSNVMRRKHWSLKSLMHPPMLYQLALRMGVSYESVAWSLNRYGLIEVSKVQELLRTPPAAIKQAILRGKLPDPTKEVWLLDDDDRTSILEPRPQDQIVVRLKSHASSGYLWQADSIKEAVREGFQLEPLTVASVSKPDNPLHFGGPETMDYLVAGGRGPSSEPVELRLSEHLPWLPGDRALDTYSSSAKFEVLEQGLTAYARQKLLEASAS